MVCPGKFLLYLKEMEWRYSNRDGNLFDLLKYMLGAVGTQSPRILLYDIQDQRTSLDRSVVKQIVIYTTKRTNAHEPK